MFTVFDKSKEIFFWKIILIFISRYRYNKCYLYHFRFPKNEIEREKWRKIVAAEREEEFFKPNDSSVICSDHFYESDMYFTKTGIRKLNKQILPHIEVCMFKAYLFYLKRHVNLLSTLIKTIYFQIDQTTSSPGDAVLSTTNIESSVSSLPSTSSTSILKEQSVDLQLNFQVCKLIKMIFICMYYIFLGY